ncbi:MAG: hypothetical protein ACLGH0_04170, partial [Thermoanaerobaculia bacterium]
IEYSDATSTLPPLTVYPGATNRTDSTNGAAGSIYIKGPSATYGDLRIVSASPVPSQQTILPSLGSGTALAGSGGATLVTDRSSIPAYFEGHWLEVIGKGTWRVASISGSTLTLESGANVATGDAWRGVYRFDVVTLSGTHRIESDDPIRANATQTITGSISIDRVDARSLVVAASSTLAPKAQNALSIKVDETLRVEANGAIDATATGYPMEVSFAGPIPGNGNGGSHLGSGGYLTDPRGITFGSIYRPREFGGGSDFSSADEGRSGGGAVSIEAGSLVVNGVIRANGGGPITTNSRGGAGGSLWIRTGGISGGGIIETNGGDAVWGAGGGGALSLTYTSGTLPQLRSRPGNKQGSNSATQAASGTVYTFGPTSTYGDLRIDNGGVGTFESTILPSFGTGTAAAGSNGATLVTDRTASIPSYFEGHWVEIIGKGTWRIVAINDKTVTLEAGANVAVGDFFRGVYRADTFTVRGSKVITADPVLAATTDKDASSTIDTNTPPQFPAALRSQIVVSRVNGNDFVTGPAGAVTDPNAPLTLTVTNVRSGQTVTGTAAANGSFSIAVSGFSGDAFTIRATDSHTLPLTSETIVVNGAISASQLQSLVINPTAVSGGENAIGTVRLVDAARNDGAVVTLSSASEFVTVPA